MAVMWAYILDDGAVAKAAALLVGVRLQFVTSTLILQFVTSNLKGARSSWQQY